MTSLMTNNEEKTFKKSFATTNLQDRPVCNDVTICDTGMFCNNDSGRPKFGFCEPCGDFNNASSCENAGLPTLGADACKAQCFG